MIVDALLNPGILLIGGIVLFMYIIKIALDISSYYHRQDQSRK